MLGVEFSSKTILMNNSVCALTFSGMAAAIFDSGVEGEGPLDAVLGAGSIDFIATSSRNIFP
ncbi:MAG: hypothetical protein LBV61_02245 [Burkholderiaceae bacterium]|jgi:hypothetical protein|nr:hypothetical protein [Burkholderiaceae bacterium]